MRKLTDRQLNEVARVLTVAIINLDFARDTIPSVFNNDLSDDGIRVISYLQSVRDNIGQAAAIVVPEVGEAAGIDPEKV